MLIVIIICFTVLVLWGVVAMGENSEKKMLNAQCSMSNKEKGNSNA